MASSAQGFVIEGGNFNEAQNQSVDHSTNYQLLNISLSSEVLHSKAGASANDFGSLLNREALDKLISQAKLLVETAKSSSSLPSEASEGSMSSSTPSISLSTVSGAIERPFAIPVPERPVKVLQEVEKRLTIYTGVDRALKKLKKSISV